MSKRIAVNIRTRVFERNSAGAFFLRVVTPERVAAKGLEQVIERSVLNLAATPRRDSPLSLLVLLDEAFLLDQIDDLGHLFLELIHIAQDALAMLEQKLRELVEDLVGRLRK